MIKTGIYTLRQLRRQGNKNLFGLDKRVSITLYNEAIEQASAQELAEKILLLFTDEEGAYKRTYHNRFAEFDKEVLVTIERHFYDTDPVVQDVGVSDARTSVDFFSKLAAKYENLNYTASDFNPKVYVITRGKTKITLSHSDKLIEILWPPFVFNAANPDRLRYYFINRLVQFFIHQFVVKRIMTDYQHGKIAREEILLFCPAAIDLSQRDTRFKLTQHDILNDFATKCNIIRAMNLLNPSYFSSREFEIILRNVFNALHEKGLLIVGSNQDAGSMVHGAIYRRDKTGFTKVYQSGDAPAIDDRICKVHVL